MPCSFQNKRGMNGNNLILQFQASRRSSNKTRTMQKLAYALPLPAGISPYSLHLCGYDKARSGASSSCAPLIMPSQHSLQKFLSSIRRCSKDRSAEFISRWHITHSVSDSISCIHTLSQATDTRRPVPQCWGETGVEQVIFYLASSCSALSLP
jgi:hypothetical protein